MWLHTTTTHPKRTHPYHAIYADPYTADPRTTTARLSFLADSTYMRDRSSCASPADSKHPSPTAFSLPSCTHTRPTDTPLPPVICPRICTGDAGSFDRRWGTSVGIPPWQESHPGMQPSSKARQVCNRVSRPIVGPGASADIPVPPRLASIYVAPIVR
jgi:hypothetical protein